MFVVKEKDRVYFADMPICLWLFDSRMTEKDCFDKENLHAYKVKNVKNCIVMGSPKLKEVDACRYDKELNKKIKQSDFTYKDIVNSIVPAMNEAIKALYQDDKDYDWKNNFAIAKGNRAFHIIDNLAYEIDDYEILIGAMRELASASFESTIGRPTIERIIEAGKTVEKVYLEKVFPIVITDTKSGKMKLYNDKGEIICQY